GIVVAVDPQLAPRLIAQRLEVAHAGVARRPRRALQLDRAARLGRGAQRRARLLEVMDHHDRRCDLALAHGVPEYPVAPRECVRSARSPGDRRYEMTARLLATPTPCA